MNAYRRGAIGFALSVLSCGNAAAQAGPMLLVGARVLAEDAASWRGDVVVRVEGGRIAAVGDRAAVSAEGAEVLDVSGRYLIPGLIDLHTHLLLHPYDETPWTDQVLRESLEARTIRGTVAARRTVEAGFTTVRDLGTEGAGFADVALRDAVAAGTIVGPRIFAVTRALVATGCYGPSGFDPRWVMPVGAQVADGADGVRVAVRQQIAAGADWIKIYADYRRRPGMPATPTFSDAEIAAAVDEARSAGLRVAAHAVTNAAMQRCVLAGVHTIEHGYEASAKTLQLMAERGVALCPTLTASESIARYSGWQDGEPEHPRVRTAREMFARALAAGVTIANGSDVGVFAHGDNSRELELMVEYGMRPQQALAAATVVAAGVLGADHLGVIRAGAAADLVVLAGDPLSDVDASRAPDLVIARGAAVYVK